MVDLVDAGVSGGIGVAGVDGGFQAPVDATNGALPGQLEAPAASQVVESDHPFLHDPVANMLELSFARGRDGSSEEDEGLNAKLVTEMKRVLAIDPQNEDMSGPDRALYSQYHYLVSQAAIDPDMLETAEDEAALEEAVADARREIVTELANRVAPNLEDAERREAEARRAMEDDYSARLADAQALAAEGRSAPVEVPDND